MPHSVLLECSITYYHKMLKKSFFKRANTKYFKKAHKKMTWEWKTWSQIDPSEQNEALNFVVASSEAVLAISAIHCFPQVAQQEDCPWTVKPSPRCCRVACTGVSTTASSWRLKKDTEGSSAGWLLVTAAGLQLTRVWSLFSVLGNHCFKLHLKFWTFYLLLIVLLF